MTRLTPAGQETERAKSAEHRAFEAGRTAERDDATAWMCKQAAIELKRGQSGAWEAWQRAVTGIQAAAHIGAGSFKDAKP